MAVRTFSLVTLDESDTIKDRYSLNLVVKPSGFGFKLNLSVISTDVEDYITKMVQQKKNITFTIYHKQGYSDANLFSSWVGSKIEETMCLEYNDTVRTLYIEGKIVDSGKTELNSYGILEETITFQPLTPFFNIVANRVRIQASSVGKSYPFKYPYAYGANIISNNEIPNIYFKEIPLIITLYGEMINPSITLLDNNNKVYNEIRFIDTNLKEGERIIINGAKKKVYLVDENGKLTDYYPKIDGAYDSYLRANPLITSSININLDHNKSGYLVGGWRQYLL